MIYLAFLFFTFLVLILAFYQWQYYMIFTPTYHKERDLGEGCSLLSMRSDDGVELEGVLYEPLNANATLLLFPGHSHDVVGMINKLASTYPKTRIISFNYRSYGKSKGKVNEKNMQEDGLKIASLVAKKYGAFYLLGYSIGSNIAAFVASQRRALGVFLVGAFDSIASLAKSKFVERGVFPNINLSQVFRYKFPTGEYMQDVDTPSYLFVSKDDAITYISNARELKSKVKNLTLYLELDGLSHKEILWDTRVTNRINEVLNA